MDENPLGEVLGDAFREAQSAVKRATSPIDQTIGGVSDLVASRLARAFRIATRPMIRIFLCLLVWLTIFVYEGKRFYRPDQAERSGIFDDKQAFPGSSEYPVLATLAHTAQDRECKDQRYRHTIACIEFNENGRFLDSDQLTVVVRHLRQRALERRLIVLLYVPGWQSSSKSNEYTQFSWFLKQVAEYTSPAVDSREVAGGKKEWEIVGIMLAWRGGLYQPIKQVAPNVVVKAGSPYEQEFVEHDPTKLYAFEERMFLQLLHWSSYFSREQASRNFASGPLAEAVANISNAARTAQESQVLLCGYSMGGSIVERSLVQLLPAGISFKAGDRDVTGGERRTRPPMDLVVLVNSSAPAYLRASLDDFCTKHGVQIDGNKPWVVSMVSDGDHAIGLAYRFASTFVRSLQWLRPDELIENCFGIRHDKELASRTLRDVPRLHTHMTRVKERGLGFVRGTNGVQFHRPSVANPPTLYAESLGYPTLVSTASGAPTRTNLQLDSFDFVTWRDGGRRLDCMELVATTNYSAREGSPSPLWVIKTDKDVISGHGAMWNANVQQLLLSLFRGSGLFDEVKKPAGVPVRPRELVFEE